MRRIPVLAIMIVATFAFPAFGEDTAPPRPKIGIALSGGGAKGCASSASPECDAVGGFDALHGRQSGNTVAAAIPRVSSTPLLPQVGSTPLIPPLRSTALIH